MSQTVQTLDIPSEQRATTERLGFFDTGKSIFLKDGLGYVNGCLLDFLLLSF